MTRLLIILALVWTPAASADDWPTFRGPKRDGHSAETGLLKQWPRKGPKQLWVSKKLGGGFSSPVIVGDRIYVTGLFASVGKLTCLDSDGKQLWQVDYGNLPTNKKSFPGAKGTPTVHEGKVYIYSQLGMLSCFEAKDGKQVWAVDTRKEFGAKPLTFGLSESPLIEGDLVIVSPGAKKASIVALDKKTGKTVWTVPLNEKAAYASAIAITRGEQRLIVTWMRSSIVGLDAKSGTLLWKFAFKNRNAVHPNAPPYRKKDGLLFFTCGYGHGCMTLKLSEDGKSVKQQMRSKQMDQWHGGAVLVGDHVYSVGSRRPAGKWCCMDPASGKTSYEERGVGLGSVITAEGMLYCYGEKGKFGLFEISPEKMTQKGEIRVKHGESHHWAHPAIANGKLYIRHGTALAVYDIKDKK